MDSGTGIKKHFGQFSTATLANAAGTLLAAALLAWNWKAVKSFLAGIGTWLAGVGAWLMGTTEVYRVVMLADFLVLAALLAWAALWWSRGRASSALVAAPVVPTAPRPPADFNPTGVQLAAMGALLQRYDQITTLAQLHEHLNFLVQTLGGKPFLAREMEQLARADVVRIDETGRTDRSYSLTMQGRDWYLDQLEDARKHPEKGTVFEPDKFELTPPRCRALLTLLHRVDSKTTLHELHTWVIGDVAAAVAKPISKGELQRDMDEGERLGLVSIDRFSTLTHYYNLTIPKGRDWVLSKEGELRVEGSKGLIRRDPRAPGR
jgi:hypothetical protein